MDSQIGEELKVYLISAWEKKNGTKVSLLLLSLSCYHLPPIAM